MGFFDFLKKNNTATTNPPAQKPKVNSFGERLDRLKNGELPFGWIYQNREFTEKIESEFSYFLNAWIDSRKKSPKEQYAALKSFVLYLEDVEKLCKAKGECYEFWFYEIVASKDYIDKRKKELEVLTELP